MSLRDKLIRAGIIRPASDDDEQGDLIRAVAFNNVWRLNERPE